MGKFRRIKLLFGLAAAGGVLAASGGCVGPAGLKGRPLTPGETKLAQEVFGNSIDYKKVTIYNGPPKIAGLIELNKDGLGAISPGGNIYLVGKDCQKPDLSQGSQSDRRLFIHEMTHVWQHQQGRFVNCEAVALFVKSGFEYNKAYAYDLDATQKFRMLNLEQQADVVEDYFALKSLPAKDAPPDRAEKIAKFERLLKPVLPLQHVATDVRKPPPPRV
ncbi:MAG: hypothetical protein ACAH80_17800 [Alphaproteobacteria bacterium]